MTHPSRLALDRCSLEPLASQSVELRTHLEICVACRAHVAAVQVELPRPAWLDTVAQPARPASWRWPVLAVAGTLVTSLAVVVAWPRTDEVTAKGTPAATVWLKRGEQVKPWASAPLKPGDTIRVEVAPSGFSHVLVAQLGEGGAPRVLYEAKLEGEKPTMLTPAWTVDAEGLEEHLAVVLSHRALSDEELAARLGRRDAESWSFDYRLPKEHP